MKPETFLTQIETCYAVVKANVGQITHDDSLVRPTPAGNNLNWVLGHLVTTRSHLLQGLGGEPVWNQAESRGYERHEPAISLADAKPLAEIWKAYDESQRRIRSVVSELTPQRLAAKAPFSPGNDPEETIGSLLGVFAFHDAYHTGQLSFVRKWLGYGQTVG